MHDPESPATAVDQLASYLGERRESLLACWRRAVDADPALMTASTITRAQFIDHIPAVLDAFERRLRARNASDRALAREEQRDSAAEHGLHRWQQGYNQPDTMLEWGHLHLCLLEELENFPALNADVNDSVMKVARQELVLLCSEGMCASATRYSQLQQSEAATRVRELESALGQLKSLEQQRSEAWREAAHDLRGRAHVIANASAALTRDDIPEIHRTRFSELLRTGVQSLSRLLTDLMDHARLEAGHERRQIEHFDIASVLRDFCETIRPLAAEKNLFLEAKGPPSLMIDGDSAKIQRILQNLILNALKVTERGGIKVTWEAGENARRAQWALCIQDTGPGFKRGSATPLERVLKQATNEAQEVEQHNATSAQSSLQADAAPTMPSQSAPAGAPLPSGEGIGLSIVKRLCEMLGASMELESAEGEGTTFRLIFPRRYPELANS